MLCRSVMSKNKRLYINDDGSEWLWCANNEAILNTFSPGVVNGILLVQALNSYQFEAFWLTKSFLIRPWSLYEDFFPIIINFKFIIQMTYFSKDSAITGDVVKDPATLTVGSQIKWTIHGLRTVYNCSVFQFWMLVQTLTFWIVNCKSFGNWLLISRAADSLEEYATVTLTKSIVLLLTLKPSINSKNKIRLVFKPNNLPSSLLWRSHSKKTLGHLRS